MISSIRESAVQEVVAGLREYFNVMLGTQLLYKFERPQYADILQEHKDKQASDIYGFIHLIRLFGKKDFISYGVVSRNQFLVCLALLDQE